jgi:hypothetical protein
MALSINGVIVPAGAQGIQGTTGSQGLSGSQGITGSQGVQGFSGGAGINSLLSSYTGKVYNQMVFFGTVANTSFSGSLIRLAPFIPVRTITISSLSIQVAGAGAGVNYRILVYDELNGIPNSKLIESTDLSCATTGVKTFSTSFTFNAGQTYFIGGYSSGTFTCQNIQLSQLMVIDMTTSGTIYSQITYSYTLGTAPSNLNSITPTYTSLTHISTNIIT